MKEEHKGLPDYQYVAVISSVIVFGATFYHFFI